MMDSTATSDLSPRQQQLAAATASAALAANAARAAQARRSAPAVGDRYVLRATAELPVEWVLLERHGELPAFLGALADTHPLVGAADFDAALAAGALRLRGGATAWIEESALDPSLWVGALDPVTVERARRKLLKSQVERDPESLGEVDASLEYRDWRREVVAPAVAALGPQERFAAPAPVAPPAVERSPRATPRRWAAAAAVFFVSTLGLAGYAGWQRERIVDLAAANRETRDAATALARTLEGERARQGQAASRTGQELRRLGEMRRAEAAKREELERRLADLQKQPASLPQAMLNLPVASLIPAELLRSGGSSEDAEVIRLSGDAPYLNVLLGLDSVEEYPAYRAVLKRQGTSSILWQTDELLAQDNRISALIDRHLFSPGIYRFDLYGLRGGRAEPLGKYDLTIIP